MTLAELEASAHVPTEDQVTTAAADRPPAGTDWERDRLDACAAGGA